MVKFVYTGQENLEAMKEAKNYNKYLASIIKTQIKTSHKKDVRILDFGAGIGTYSDLLLEEGIKVDCLELDKDQVKLLKSKGYTTYDGLDKVKSKYDIVYAFNVFEHIENDIDVFAQLSKVLSKNGSAVIYVPAFQVLFSSMDTLVGHHRRYRLDRLKRMADEAKLDISYLGYGEPLGFLAALVYKVLGNKNGTISAGSVKTYDKYAFPVSKAVSPLFKYIFGKNALLVATKKK